MLDFGHCHYLALAGFLGAVCSGRIGVLRAAETGTGRALARSRRACPTQKSAPEALMQPATIEHVVPGRIRLKFSGQRGNTEFFKDVVDLVSQFPAVEEARANPLTGSLLVHYRGDLEDLAQAAVKLGLITVETLSDLLARQRSASGWAAMLRQTPVLLAFALSAIGVLQLARGRALGPASEHFWHARELWLTGKPQAALGLGLLGLLQLSRANLFGSATSLLVYGLMLQNGRRGR